MLNYLRNVLLLVLDLVTTIFGNESKLVVQCDGLMFRGRYYDKHTLFESPGKPYNMFLDRYSGNLLFSYTITLGTELNFQIMICHIEKLICKRVEDVPGGYAIGYDIINDDIYLGGDQGLYKYNIETNKAEYFAERGQSIWGIFIKRNFYYIRYPFQQLYVQKKLKFKRLPETIGFEIDNFFVSKNREVYFSNGTGLYKAKMNKKDKMPNLIKNNIVIRQITEDIYGNVYFCARDGIYTETKNVINKIADIDNPYSITFATHFYLSPPKERNHMIYSDKYGIYILIRSNFSKFCSRVYKLRNTNQPVKLVQEEV